MNIQVKSRNFYGGKATCFSKYKGRKKFLEPNLLVHGPLLVILVIVTFYTLYTVTTPPENSHKLASVDDRNLTKYLTRKSHLHRGPNQPECLNTELLIGVISSPANSAARYAIRDQWGRDEFQTEMKTTLIFVVGRTHDENISQQNRKESQQNKDILFLSLDESYANLTLKVLLFFKWAKENCHKARFILKMDDDVYINSKKMSVFLKCVNTEFLDQYKQTKEPCLQHSPKDKIGHYVDASSGKYKSYIAAGYMLDKVAPMRDPKSRWYLNRSLYPFDTLPPTLSGPAYLLSHNLVPLILEESKNELTIGLEDVYITGLLLFRNLGLKLSHIDGWTNYRPLFNDICLFNEMMTVHGLDSNELRKISGNVRNLKVEDCGIIRAAIAKLNKLFVY